MKILDIIAERTQIPDRSGCSRMPLWYIELRNLDLSLFNYLGLTGNCIEEIDKVNSLTIEDWDIAINQALQDNNDDWADMLMNAWRDWMKSNESF